MYCVLHLRMSLGIQWVRQLVRCCPLLCPRHSSLCNRELWIFWGYCCDHGGSIHSYLPSSESELVFVGDWCCNLCAFIWRGIFRFKEEGGAGADAPTWRNGTGAAPAGGWVTQFGVRQWVSEFLVFSFVFPFFLGRTLFCYFELIQYFRNSRNFGIIASFRIVKSSKFPKLCLSFVFFFGIIAFPFFIIILEIRTLSSLLLILLSLMTELWVLNLEPILLGLSCSCLLSLI